MKHKVIPSIYVLVFVLAATNAAFLFADNIEMPQLLMPSTRNAGRGGSHVAYTNDMYSLFVNPAALMYANRSSALELAPALMLNTEASGVESLVRKIIDGDDIVKALGDFASKTDGRLPLGLDFRGPISIAHVRSGLGWGLFSRENVDLRINGTDIDALAHGDVIFNFGMSFNVLSTQRQALDAGFVAKAFGRVLAEASLNALDMVSDPDAVLDGISIPFIIGGGIDFGLLYTVKNFLLLGNLSLGLTFDDVFTRGFTNSVDTYFVPFTMNFGAAYTIDWNIIRVSAMADFHDFTRMLDSAAYDDFSKRNPLLGISFGLDASLFNIFHAGLGLKDWLPSVGAAVTVGGFELSFSYYGKELGIEPGQYSVYVLDLSLAIRWNTTPVVRNYNKTSIIEKIFAKGEASDAEVVEEP
jgi:hypothetical protein